MIIQKKEFWWTCATLCCKHLTCINWSLLTTVLWNEYYYHPHFTIEKYCHLALDHHGFQHLLSITSPNHGWTKTCDPSNAMLFSSLQANVLPPNFLEVIGCEYRSIRSQTLICPHYLCQSSKLNFFFLHLGSSFLSWFAACRFSRTLGCSNTIARILFLKSSSDYLFLCLNFKRFFTCLYLTFQFLYFLQNMQTLRMTKSMLTFGSHPFVSLWSAISHTLSVSANLRSHMDTTCSTVFSTCTKPRFIFLSPHFLSSSVTYRDILH